MDVKKGREVVAQYRSLLQFVPIGEGPFDDEPRPNEAMCHVRGMLDKMDEMLDEAEDREPNGLGLIGPEPDLAWDKFNRWLGFVQGCFWVSGTYTLNQMRDHNRPDSGPTVEEQIGALENLEPKTNLGEVFKETKIKALRKNLDK